MDDTALRAAFWALHWLQIGQTVRHNADKARQSQKLKVLWQMRPEETKFAWHYTVKLLPYLKL